MVTAATYKYNNFNNMNNDNTPFIGQCATEEFLFLFLLTKANS